jgi:hypothetical protein
MFIPSYKNCLGSSFLPQSKVCECDCTQYINCTIDKRSEFLLGTLTRKHFLESLPPLSSQNTVILPVKKFDSSVSTIFGTPYQRPQLHRIVI